MAGVHKEKEETSWQRHDAYTDGVTQDIPSAGTRALHPKPVEEHRDSGQHGEERDSVSVSRPGLSDHEKGPNPAGKSIRVETVHAANTYVVKTQAAPMTFPKIENTMCKCSRKEPSWGDSRSPT